MGDFFGVGNQAPRFVVFPCQGLFSEVGWNPTLLKNDGLVRLRQCYVGKPGVQSQNRSTCIYVNTKI